MLKRLLIAFVLAVFALSPASAQGSKDVTGRVFDAANRRGIENLEVKLTPPRNSNLPIRLTSTDQNGGFRFPQVRQSRYLLEVSQGANLLYRSEVDIATASDLQVPLQKR